MTVLFQAHATIYVAFTGFLFLINLASGMRDVWFYWPAIGYGPILAFHAVVTYFYNSLGMSRSSRRLARKHLPRTRPAVAALNSRRVPTGVPSLVRDGSALVDAMRATSRRIPNPAPRQQALAFCDVADGVLAAMADHPEEERVGQEFLSRFLTPAHHILTTYERLANRAVPSAEPILTRVEDEDLPLMLKCAHDVYDRLHRATLIDLEVSREMMRSDLTEPGRFSGGRHASAS
jgi:hypothetical protein